ncbi:hypothetical protein GN956_G20726 [Arapaima gigas]
MPTRAQHSGIRSTDDCLFGISTLSLTVLWLNRYRAVTGSLRCAALFLPRSNKDRGSDATQVPLGFEEFLQANAEPRNSS